MNAILGVYTDLDEVTNLQCDYLETLEKCKHLEKELSKSRTMSKSFEALQKHAINLELDLQQCKEKIKNDKSFKENQSNVFLKEREQYFEIQDLKAQLQDKGIAISELKKLIEKMKGKSVETKFEKSSIHQSPRGIFINQAKYAQEILKKHGMTSCDSIGTPMATKHLDADLSGTLVDQTKYRSMVGALMYLTASRPDIVHATYSDHVGCLDSRKSTYGGIQFLGGDKLVSWSSKKQDCTSMSLAEVEYHFIKEQVEKGIVELFFVGTEYQLADLFTKALSEDRFKYLVRRLGMRCLTPDELEVLAIESA
ncbi:hypothetical protein Tco_1086294 [Tanacetum coccineum]